MPDVHFNSLTNNHTDTHAIESKKIRSFLKWAGGKYRCLEHILSLLPKATRLIEPFVGSGVVFMNTHYSQYLLADTNRDLINLYQQLQLDHEHFITACMPYFSDQTNQNECYYAYREKFNQTRNKKLRAYLLLYLNRHGYNGLCRYNQQGIYNVPFGRYEHPYFPENELRQFYKKSQTNTTFICADFQKTFAEAKPGDVIYCDPPYAPLQQSSNFTSYSKKKFGEKEQIKLAKLAMKTASRGIPVIISNHDTSFTREQYNRAQIHTFKVSRTISQNIQERNKISELIAVF